MSDIDSARDAAEFRRVWASIDRTPMDIRRAVTFDQSVRLRPSTGGRPVPKFPMAPFLRAATRRLRPTVTQSLPYGEHITRQEIARQLDLPDPAVLGRRTVSFRLADRLATALNTHPSAIWGDLWFTISELADNGRADLEVA